MKRSTVLGMIILSVFLNLTLLTTNTGLTQTKRPVIVILDDTKVVNSGDKLPTVNMYDYLGPPGITKIYSVKRYSNTGTTDDVLTASGDTWQFASGGGSYYWWESEEGPEGYRTTKEQFYDSEGILRSETIYDPYYPGLAKGEKTLGGASWGGGYLEITTNYSVDPPSTWVKASTIMYTIIGLEDVTVPAGTFRDCVKIYRDTGSSSNSRVTWYAKGIGTVKRIYAGYEFPSTSRGRLYELTSYQVQE